MKESVGYGARLYFFDYCKEGEDIIFPAINTNWLCSMNENGVVRIMAAIPKQEGIKIALYPGIFKSDDIIYLFPYNGNKKQILLYNLKTYNFYKSIKEKLIYVKINFIYFFVVLNIHLLQDMDLYKIYYHKYLCYIETHFPAYTLLH